MMSRTWRAAVTAEPLSSPDFGGSGDERLLLREPVPLARQQPAPDPHGVPPERRAGEGTRPQPRAPRRSPRAYVVRAVTPRLRRRRGGVAPAASGRIRPRRARPAVRGRAR